MNITTGIFKKAWAVSFVACLWHKKKTFCIYLIASKIHNFLEKLIPKFAQFLTFLFCSAIKNNTPCEKYLQGFHFREKKSCRGKKKQHQKEKQYYLIFKMLHPYYMINSNSST